MLGFDFEEEVSAGVVPLEHGLAECEILDVILGIESFHT